MRKIKENIISIMGFIVVEGIISVCTQTARDYSRNRFIRFKDETRQIGNIVKNRKNNEPKYDVDIDFM